MKLVLHLIVYSHRNLAMLKSARLYIGSIAPNVNKNELM